MPSSLNLSLPEAPRPRHRAHWTQWLTLLLGIAVLAVLVVNQPETATAPTVKDPLEAEHLETLALNLEKRTFYAQASDVWGEYLELAEISPEKRADVLYRRGKCLKEVGRYAEASRWLSEVEDLPLSSTKKRTAGQLLMDCATALGKTSTREALSRQFATQDPEETSEEKGTILARIGEEIITKEELRDQAVRAARQMLALQGAAMTPAELTQQAEALVDAQMKNPQASQQFLQQAVSSRVLYLEGLARGFGEDERALKEISRVREGLVANRVVEAEMEKALESLGPTEISNHYEAHKERFVEKAGSQFAYARFDTEDAAKAALEKLRQGNAATEAALKRPQEFIAEGDLVPEIGPSAEIVAHVLALKKSEIGDRAIEHGGGFYIFRGESKRPQRQLTFEEAEARVKADLANIKREEARKKLSDLLQEKYKVEIVEPKPESPGGAPTDGANEGTPGNSEAPDANSQNPKNPKAPQQP